MAIATLFIASLSLHAQQGPPPGGGGRGMSPEQRAEQQTTVMKDSLSLSTKQLEKVKEINLKYANKMKAARDANQEADREQMRATMDTIHSEHNAELKTVLTKEQYDQWLKVQENHFKHRGPGGGEPGKGGRKGKRGDKKSE